MTRLVGPSAARLEGICPIVALNNWNNRTTFLHGLQGEMTDQHSLS
jgi:hypothetical protein